MNRGFNRSIQLNRWNLNYMLQKQQKSALLHASVMPFFFNNSTLYEQVVSSEGPSGHNVEYLLKLAEIWSQLPSNGLMGLNLWSPHTLT